MNENHIKTLRIENFKSIKEMDLECSRINVFVGKPNVGKSNILEALGMYGAGFSGTEKYLSDIVRLNAFSNLFYDNDTSLDIKIELKRAKDSDYLTISFKEEKEIYRFHHVEMRMMPNSISSELENRLGEVRTTNIDSEGKIINISSPANLNLKLTKKYTFRPNALHNHPLNSYLLPPYGKNLVRVIETNKKLRDKIAGFFSEYGYEILLDFKEKTFEIQKRIDNISYKTDYNLIADTLQRMIFHHTAILSNKNSVLLFEEPESHSYPPYIAELAEAIIDDENENQYFLTTHSPFIFNKLVEKSKEVSVFIITYENYETKVKKLTDEQLSELLDYGVNIFYNLNWYVND